MRFISAILAQYYEPDRVHDYYSEGAKKIEIPEGLAAIILIISLIISIYTVLEKKGDNNNNIGNAIFGGLAVFVVLVAFLTFIASLFY